MKKLLALMLALVLLVSDALAFDLFFFGNKEAEEPAAEVTYAAMKFEGPGYASPEDAARAYVEALKNQDAMAAVATFAVESYVDNSDFEARAERLKVYTLNSHTGMMLTENAYFRQVQVLQRLADISDAMHYAYLHAIWDAEQLGGFGEPVRFNEEMVPAAMREILSQGEVELGFDEIEVLGILDIHLLDPEVADHYYSDVMRKNFVSMSKDYGADELTDVIVHLKIGGVNYLQFMQCVRYGDVWYNLTPHGPLASMVALDYYCGGLVARDAFSE